MGRLTGDILSSFSIMFSTIVFSAFVILVRMFFHFLYKLLLTFFTAAEVGRGGAKSGPLGPPQNTVVN